MGTAALREAAEEAGIDPGSVRITGVHTDDHGGWSYATVLAEGVGELTSLSANAESVEVRWQPVHAVDRLPLHPGFAATWPALREAFPPPRLVVDAANVVGSRPDGWWHARRAATQRLHDQLAVFARSGLEPWSWPKPDRIAGPSTGPEPWFWPKPDRIAGPSTSPEPSSRPQCGGVVGLSWLYPHVTMVVEGQGRQIAADAALTVVRAAGSGDDAIVDVVREHPHSIVVTADRELRQRVRALGADVVGPRWLWAAITV